MPKLRKAGKKTKTMDYLAQLSLLYAILIASRTAIINFSIIILKQDPELPLFDYFLVTVVSATLLLVPFFIAFKLAAIILRLTSRRDTFLVLIASSILYSLYGTSTKVDFLNLINFVPNALLYDPFFTAIHILISSFYFFLTVLAFGFIYRTIKMWWRK